MNIDSNVVESFTKGYKTAESKWARFGPYYAMFPTEFAFDVVLKHSQAGDLVIDPFAGRGSSIFSAAALGRIGVGIEINPVGWIYSTTKLLPAEEKSVLERLNTIIELSQKCNSTDLEKDIFFKMCFSESVLRALQAARLNLDWINSSTDRTLMAFILLYLHGKRGQSLSNQMPMMKSTSKQYSVNWWRNKSFETPPDIDVKSFLTSRIKWRYNRGATNFKNSYMILGDSSEELDTNKTFDKVDKKAKLLFTSPPYYGVTNYFADQWLRMWMLEELYEKHEIGSEKHKKRFASKEEYHMLIDQVINKSLGRLDEDATIYVRTDIREFTYNTTIEILKKYFPNHKLSININECQGNSQTAFLGNKEGKHSEVDILLTKHH